MYSTVNQWALHENCLKKKRNCWRSFEPRTIGEVYATSAHVSPVLPCPAACGLQDAKDQAAWGRAAFWYSAWQADTELQEVTAFAWWTRLPFLSVSSCSTSLHNGKVDLLGKSPAQCEFQHLLALSAAKHPRSCHNVHVCLLCCDDYHRHPPGPTPEPTSPLLICHITS